jgi:ATP-binding cassette subfamily B protein
LYLFDGTIGENILFTDTGNTDLLSMASRKSDAEKFIRSLPLGFETRVTANGGAFSGGERQKIGVARAFARQAGIIILDEATAHFDRESEGYLVRLLGEELEGKTVILVSHKPHIVRFVDRVVRLENGREADEIRGEKTAVMN